MLGLQITLKDFQTTMRVAKGKEAANLPKKKPSIANTPFAHSSQDLEGRFQDTERQVLLQVRADLLLHLTIYHNVCKVLAAHIA